MNNINTKVPIIDEGSYMKYYFIITITFGEKGIKVSIEMIRKYQLAIRLN